MGIANIKTVTLTREEYIEIITAIKEGFRYGEGKIFKPNLRIAAALTVQANIGLRIGDILNLRLSSFLKDGNRYRLDIEEEKTGKARTYTVPTEIYVFLMEYANSGGIGPKAKLFDITERAVQKQLKIVTEHLRLERISTHSFRNFFVTEIYIKSDYNIQLVKELLQHSNVNTTQRYIGISSKQLEDALQSHIYLV